MSRNKIALKFGLSEKHAKICWGPSIKDVGIFKGEGVSNSDVARY